MEEDKFVTIHGCGDKLFPEFDQSKEKLEIYFTGREDSVEYKKYLELRIYSDDTHLALDLKRSAVKRLARILSDWLESYND
jgi:hypothetical protein